MSDSGHYRNKISTNIQWQWIGLLSNINLKNINFNPPPWPEHCYFLNYRYMEPIIQNKFLYNNLCKFVHLFACQNTQIQSIEGWQGNWINTMENEKWNIIFSSKMPIFIHISNIYLEHVEPSTIGLHIVMVKSDCYFLVIKNPNLRCH